MSPVSDINIKASDGETGPDDNPEDVVDLPNRSQSKSSESIDVGGDNEEGGYNVEDFYWEKGAPGLGGMASQLAKNKRFEICTLSVISMNGMWIGYDTDWNDAESLTEADIQFVIAENVFCVYFTFEVMVRFCAFKMKRSCLNDGWFKFDSVLVTMMIMETWIMPLAAGGGAGGLGQLSILRLLRLTRLVRLMRSVPELLTLVKGMFAATRSVGSTLVLLVAFLYIFGIVFTQTYRDRPGSDYMGELFGCMGMSMLTLFVNGTLLDNLTGVMLGLREDNQIMMWVFVIFVLVSSFTVLNMLIGVLCEVVTATSEAEKEAMVNAEAATILKKVFKEIDTDKSGQISLIEFTQMEKNEEAIEALEKLGIEMHMVKGLAEVLFAQDEDETVPEEKDKLFSPRSPRSGRRNSVPPAGTKELSFKEFLDRLSHLKPGTGVSVLDFADLQKQCLQTSRKVEKKIESLQRKMSKLGAPVPAEDGPEGTPTAGGSRSPMSAPFELPMESPTKGYGASNLKDAASAKNDDAPVVSPEDLTQVSTDDLLSELYSRLGKASARSGR